MKLSVFISVFTKAVIGIDFLFLTRFSYHITPKVLERSVNIGKTSKTFVLEQSRENRY